MNRFTQPCFLLICLVFLTTFTTRRNLSAGEPPTFYSYLPLVARAYDSAEIYSSVPRGVYDTPFIVDLSSQVPGALIRYTLDGSMPTTTSGMLYSGPVAIYKTTIVRAVAYSSNIPPENVGTWSYLFPTSVLTQGNEPIDYPSQWGGFSADYAVDQTIVTSSSYLTEMLATLTDLPSVSIVTDISNLFTGSGIYHNPLESGRDWERPTSMEVLFPDPSQNEQLDAGIRIQGHGSRDPANSPKHSFRLYFRSSYGPSDFESDLFEEQPNGHLATDEFDKLVLRAGYNNSWIYRYGQQRSRALYIRDSFARHSQLAMGQPAVHGRYVHLYLNGLYWGLYNLQERPDSDFFASYFGGSDDDYDVMNGTELADGDETAWLEMQDYFASTDVSDPANYQTAISYLDLDNFIDFVLLNHYLGNDDWASSNWYAGRKREAGARFIFLNWDSEKILATTRQHFIDTTYPQHPSLMFSKLRANNDFRIAFADRLYKHFFNEGALTTASSTNRLNQLAGDVSSAVVAESARWGDYRSEVQQVGNPFKLYERDTDWQQELDRLRNNYIGQRSDFILNEYRERDLYPSIQPPTFSQDGGNVAADFVLMLSNPNDMTGDIWFTVDGSDPRPAGNVGAPNGINGGDSAEITLITSSQIKARIYNSATLEWSALHEATFAVNATLDNLLITELMYNPLTDDDYEFIEFKNIGAGTLVLDGVLFSDGIEYIFPAATQLAAGNFYILAKEPQLFTERYGFAPDNANGYSGKLSNGGETLALSDADGQGFLSFTYDDEGGWPTEPDGAGNSLVSAEPNANPDLNDPTNWRSSSAVNGSPDQDDPQP